MAKQALPVLTANGLTAVHHARFLAGNRLRPEHSIDTALALLANEPLAKHSYIKLNGYPEYWEYVYIHKGWHREPVSWEEWRDARAPTAGTTTIFGNFEGVSSVFRFITKDAELVAKFEAAFRANPGYPATLEYDAESRVEFDRYRYLYGKTPEEAEANNQRRKLERTSHAQATA